MLSLGFFRLEKIRMVLKKVSLEISRLSLKTIRLGSVRLSLDAKGPIIFPEPGISLTRHNNENAKMGFF